MPRWFRPVPRFGFPPPPRPWRPWGPPPAVVVGGALGAAAVAAATEPVVVSHPVVVQQAADPVPAATADSAVQKVQVQVPSGVKSGDKFLVTFNGVQFSVVCPAGVKAGDTVIVNVPPSAPAQAPAPAPAPAPVPAPQVNYTENVQDSARARVITEASPREEVHDAGRGMFTTAMDSVPMATQLHGSTSSAPPLPPLKRSAKPPNVPSHAVAATAGFDLVADASNGTLGFVTGDKLWVHDIEGDDNTDWCMGYSADGQRSGLVPRNYLQ